MTPLQKLQLRASEIRTKLGQLGAVEQPTDEQRAEITKLTNEYQTLETRQQALIVAGDDPDNPDGETATQTETRTDDRLADLETRSSVEDVMVATLHGRDPEGATRELQQELSLGGNQVPLALIRPRGVEVRDGVPADLETRAVTPAPANVGQNQAAIIPGVFPQSVAAFLGVDMPTVGVGEQVYPVLTQNADVGVPAENAAQDETTGSFSADVLSPGRLQASFFYSREDRARFSGMDEALRENLNAALADALDKQIVAGANGLLHGANLTAHNAAAVTTYALYRSQLAYGRVDGTYAGSVGDIKIVMGSGTYAHCSGQFRSDNAGDRAALEDLMAVTGGVRVSAHVPAVSNAHKQNAIVRLGSRRDMVAPIWEGVTLIPDEVTKAANGQIMITAVALYAIKILRAAGFYKQQIQHQ